MCIKCFQNFQQFVERKFECKIKTMQNDWVENIKNSMGFFNVLALKIVMPQNRYYADSSVPAKIRTI
jgi:hypothetical protein